MINVNICKHINIFTDQGYGLIKEMSKIDCKLIQILNLKNIFNLWRFISSIIYYSILNFVLLYF